MMVSIRFATQPPQKRLLECSAQTAKPFVATFGEAKGATTEKFADKTCLLN